MTMEEGYAAIAGGAQAGVIGRSFALAGIPMWWSGAVIDFSMTIIIL
jgi:hypothetical protein